MRTRFARFAAALAFVFTLSVGAECAAPAFANPTRVASRVSTRVATNLSISLAAAGGAPTISSLGTSSGTEVGGTSVVINGTGFTGASAVTFNGVNATGYTVNSSIAITATAPAYTSALSSTAADNAVAVAVTTAGGTATLSASYTYTSQAKALAGAIYFAEYRVSDPRITVASGACSSIPDFNGNAALAQASATERPVYSATGSNGGPSCSNSSSNDWLQAAFSPTLASSTRPYFFVVIQGIAGTAGAFWELSNGAAQTTYAEMTTGAGQWTFYLQPVSFNGTTNFTPDDLTTIHVWEAGFTAGGTNAFVKDGTGANNSRTVVTGNACTHFTMFAEYNGANQQSARFVYVLVLNDEPSGTVKTNLRTFLTGANFPGYTSNKLKP